MGGMSVTDVKFIIECYNAERERKRNDGGMLGTAGGLGAVAVTPQAAAAAAAAVEAAASNMQQQQMQHSGPHPNMSMPPSQYGLSSPPSSGTCSPPGEMRDAMMFAKVASQQQHHQQQAQYDYMQQQQQYPGQGLMAAGPDGSNSRSRSPSISSPCLPSAPPSGPGFNAFSYEFFGGNSPTGGDALGDLERIAGDGGLDLGLEADADEATEVGSGNMEVCTHTNTHTHTHMHLLHP
jgi:hypothetical protein